MVGGEGQRPEVRGHRLHEHEHEQKKRDGVMETERAKERRQSREEW